MVKSYSNVRYFTFWSYWALKRTVVELIRYRLVTQFQQFGVENNSLWTQQDGATAQTTNASIAALRGPLPWHLISRLGDDTCPARSLDLTACIVCCLFCGPNKVFVSKPHTNADLIK